MTPILIVNPTTNSQDTLKIYFRAFLQVLGGIMDTDMTVPTHATVEVRHSFSGALHLRSSIPRQKLILEENKSATR